MDETEKQEKERLARENKKNVEDMARAATTNMGKIYLDQKGIEQVKNDELAVKSFLMAWADIMGSQIAWNVSAVEIMLSLMSRLPLDCGMDIMQRPSYIQFQSMLGAVRNKMIADRDARVKASVPELFT